MTKLSETRDWFTIEEAAEELSGAVGAPISDADVLRLALDGDLHLSLYVPEPITARCRREGAKQLAPFHHSREVQGLCDLPIRGFARAEIEGRHQYLYAGTSPAVDDPVGVRVVQDGWECVLPPDPGAVGPAPRPKSEFPEGSVLAVRSAVLLASLNNQATAPAPRESAPETPLGQRERATLLVIIGALCRRLKSAPDERGLAGQIAQLTQELDAPVSDDTIRKVLRQVDDTIKSRLK